MRSYMENRSLANKTRLDAASIKLYDATNAYGVARE